MLFVYTEWYVDNIVYKEYYCLQKITKLLDCTENNVDKLCDVCHLVLQDKKCYLT